MTNDSDPITISDTDSETSTDSGPGDRLHVPSLAEQAEQKIFDELSHHIKQKSQESVFAVGGSISITSLNDHLICESDDTQSEGGDGSRDLLQANEYSDFPLNRTPGNVSHNMRCEPITIRWDSITDASSSHKVTLPVKDDERPMFEQLLKDCSPASFGRGGKDVMDETYRKAGKLDEAAFCTNFNPYALGIVETAAQALVLNNKTQTNGTHVGIRAELYKLNVYSAPSGMFKAHVDTPRSKHQIGSLVVCLPHIHEGRQLLLRHQGQETVFDWSGEKGKTSIQWAAFYSDCEYEVLEVTSGERVTLTYNLYAACSANTALIDPEHVELYHTIKTLLEQPGFCKHGAMLGYHCSHAYPHTSKDTIAALPATLKGVDKVVHTCFAATNHSVRLRHLLDIEVDEDGICSDDPDFRKEFDGSILSDELVPWNYTQTGLYGGEGTDDIIRSWTDDYTVETVNWLNESGHSEPALVHGAYGNQASIETTYARLVIILEVPPFSYR